MTAANASYPLWDYEFDPPELTGAEQVLFDKYLKATSGDERNRIEEELQKSLEDRGKRFAGIDRDEGKLNGVSAGPGVYKLTLRAAGIMMVKPLTVRQDPILE